MLPSFAPHLYHCPDFLAGILGVVVVEYIFEHRKIIFPFGAVHIVVDGDKADVIGRKDEILQSPHVGILPAQPGQVFDNYSGYAVILHKEPGVPKSMIGGVFAQQGFLRRDLSRSVFAKQCAIRIDKQQKEHYNNVVIDNDVII